jgi:hypothetical protein
LKPEWWGSPLVQEEKYQENPVKREEIIIIKLICVLYSETRPVVAVNKFNY